MSSLSLPRIALASVTLGALIGLAACTTDTTAEEPPANNTASQQPSDAPADNNESEEPAAPDTPPAPPTCETLLSESLVSSLTEVGWTAQSQDFNVGGFVIDGGLLCTWGDYTVASDHVQIYGWAPIDESQTKEAQQILSDAGWLRSEQGSDVFFTEPQPMETNADEDGYGMTYQFGEDWVTVADTKQGLLLIQRP